jgi:DNA invertase Pin-like site-specific DNA recombinase
MTSSTAKSFGYIRVSTVAQNLDRQVDALVDKCHIAPDDIYSDKISGTKESRPGLDALMKVVRSGDTITVHSLDRLGRSTLHVMQTLAMLEERGIKLVSLKDGDQTYTGATGKFMRDMMVLVATWEREMNRERVAEARAAKSARTEVGEQVAGRPRTALTTDKISEVHKLKAKGRSAAEIAKLANMSRASVYRALEVNKQK